MNLTTRSRVKTLDTAYQDVSNDAKLDAVIAGVSAKVETYLERTVLKGTYTELFNITKCTQKEFFTKAFPVTDVTSFKELTERADTNPYVWDLKWLSWSDNTLGRVSLNYNNLYKGYGSVEIVYDGGMADDTDDFVTNYPDIAFQVDIQVIFEMQRMQNLVDKVIAIGDQNITKHNMDFLPSVKMVLDKHKRKLGLY